MNYSKVFDKYDEQGWNDSTKLNLVLDFLDRNTGNLPPSLTDAIVTTDMFDTYLGEVADEENAPGMFDTYLDEVADEENAVSVDFGGSIIVDSNGLVVGKEGDAETDDKDILPCIYELDGDGEATGSVNYYCSQACFAEGLKDHAFENSITGKTAVSALCSGAQCYNCSKELGSN